MPGSRKYRRKKSYRRRTNNGYSWKHNAAAAAGLAYSAYSNRAAIWEAINKLRGLVNSEMYKYDQSQTSLQLTNSGGTLHISSVAQGDGDNARTGNSLFARCVNIKGILRFNSASSKLYQPCRLMVVQDSQQIGDTSPGVTNVLESATTYGHMNSDTVGRFKVLYNKVFNLNTGANVSIPFTINLPMRHHIRYNGTAATDIQRGGLYFMYMSNESVSTDQPYMDYECRLSYHDN